MGCIRLYKRLVCGGVNLALNFILSFVFICVCVGHYLSFFILSLRCLECFRRFLPPTYFFIEPKTKNLHPRDFK